MHSHRLPRWCPAVLALAAVLALTADGATIKFDQSQTGDYNMQIHLKNIELYAVFDYPGTSDDDYGDLPDYTDPSEAPSKPGSSSSSSSSSSSPSPSPSPSPPPSPSAASAASTPSPSAASTGSPPFDSPSNSDKIVQMVEALIASNGNTSDLPVEQPAGAPSPPPPPPPPSLTQAQQEQPQPSSSSANASNTANRKCGPGYFRDPMGRCRRIRKPHLPFLQMVHTPGVIKSFQPQQRTTDDVNVTKN